MTVITKFNPIQIGPFQISQKLRLGTWYKKAYLCARRMRLGKSV